MQVPMPKVLVKAGVADRRVGLAPPQTSGNASRARTRISPRTWQQRFIETETLVRHAQEAERVERRLEGLVVERKREARREVAHRALTW